MTRLDLKIGDTIRHLKRGSEYEVLGFEQRNSMDVRDGKAIKMRLCHDSAVPALMQNSTPLHAGVALMVVYRALVSKPGEPWLFMRPVSEFTTDRFTKVF